MTGRVRRLARAPPSLRDFVAGASTSPVGWPAHLLLSEISFAGTPTSPVGGPDAPPCLGDFVRWRSGISRRLADAPPSLRDFVAGAPTSPVGGPVRLLLSEISFAGAPTSPATCGGAVQTGKRKSAFK